MIVRAHSLFWAALLLSAATACVAQDTSTGDSLHDALPPSAILDQTLQPFDAARADMANWSDTETAALGVAVRTAGPECKRLQKAPQEGEELFALSRLCALGLEWPGTYSAAARYVRDEKTPHLVQAYALLVQADLNMKAVGNAVDHLKEMSGRVPYSVNADSVFSYALALLDVAQPEVGIRVARMRQPMLLKAIAAGEHAPDAVLPGTAEAEAVHYLELLKFANHPETEVEVAAIDLQKAVSARTVTVSPAEAYAVAVARRRYERLGKPLPAFEITKSNYAAAYRADRKVLKLLVIFPENCVQCAHLPEAMDHLRARLNSRVAEAWIVEDASGLNAAAPPSPTDPDSKPKLEAVVHRILTKSPLLQELGADSAPFFAVTDSDGLVRFLSHGPPTWLPVNWPEETTIEVVMDRVANATSEADEPKLPKPASGSTTPR